MTKPELTKERIAAAYAVAIIADLLQFPIVAAEFSFVGAFSGEGAACVLDVVVMAIMTKLLGFHMMFLPTMALEAMPVFSALPSWVGCVAFVVWQQKKESNFPSPLPITREVRSVQPENSRTIAAPALPPPLPVSSPRLPTLPPPLPVHFTSLPALPPPLPLSAYAEVVVEPRASSDAEPGHRLKRINDLLAQGLISGTEYDAKRQQILQDL